jgi:hypothetical protein
MFLKLGNPVSRQTRSGVLPEALQHGAAARRAAASCPAEIAAGRRRDGPFRREERFEVFIEALGRPKDQGVAARQR